MADTRRGFLKTLGKLGAAVGLTAAVATVDLKSTDAVGLRSSSLTQRQKDDIATQVQTQVDDIKRNGGTLINTKTGKKTVYPTKRKDMMWDVLSTSTDPVADVQKAVNELTAMRLDNAEMMIHPSMVVAPPHIYDYVQRQEAIRDLDPYNWGAVFDLKWVDWNQPLNFATAIGRWEARVKPQFRGIFKGEVYTQSKEIAMSYLEQQVSNAMDVKKYAKEQCYRELVDHLQNVILERIKRDVKENPPTGHVEQQRIDLSSITK